MPRPSKKSQIAEARNVYGKAKRLYKTIGCKVENERLPFRKVGAAVLDTPIQPFTGDKQVTVIGWARGRKLTIMQDQPLPMCVLAIIKRVTLGD